MSAVDYSSTECPVCLEEFKPPIYQCVEGHSICGDCTRQLQVPSCPHCRKEMTQIRNLYLEKIVMETERSCPNATAEGSRGCVYKMLAMDLDEHLSNCIFRRLDCPIGCIFGKCSWNGLQKDLLHHFNLCHPANCNISSDDVSVIENVDLNTDDRHVFLCTVGKTLFLMTIKIDTLKKMCYWTVQLLGSKLRSQNWIYEIHVVRGNDERRKAVFIDYCVDSQMKTDEVFKTGKCATIPLMSLSNFLNDKKLGFRYFIKYADKGNKPGSKGPGLADNNSGPGKPKGPSKGTAKEPGPQKPKQNYFHKVY